MITKREWEILDRFTRMDEKLELMAKTLEQIKDLLAGVRPPIVPPIVPRVEVPRVEIPRVPIELAPIVGKLDEILALMKSTYIEYLYFTYPNDGTRKTIPMGKTLIDFYEGIVKFPDGTSDRLNYSLKTYNRLYAHSFAIEISKDAIYSFDDKNKKPIYANDFHSETFQNFQRVYIETTEEASFTVWASTNPQAFIRKLKGRHYWNEGDTFELTVGTSAIPLTSRDTPCKGCFLKADDDNTGDIYWGFRPNITAGGGATSGYKLRAPQGSDIPIDNLNKIYVIASTANQKIYVSYGR